MTMDTCAAGWRMMSLCLGLLLTCLTYVQGELTEHCQSDFFKASCDAGHVIVVTEATYGRIRVGRCVKEDFGYLGCKYDVQAEMDRVCSGRRQCSIRVLDDMFPGIPPCHDDLKSSLEIDYRCQRVITAPKHHCTAMQPVASTLSTGFISSLIADETKCGSADAPWLIQAAPGQKVNITLLDFSTTIDNTSSSSSSASDGPGSSSSSSDDVATVCRVYATIRESAIGRSATICGGERRERAVYISSQHAVEIRVISSKTPHKNVHFLLKYETVGCPSAPAPEDGWVKHRDNVAMFSCKHIEDTWQWLCKDNQWVGDLNKNCSIVNAARNASHTEVLGFMSLPMGLSIVIIMALAFVVGVLVLAIGLVFLRRQRPHQRPPRPDTYQDTALMLTDHTSNEIYVKHAITCNITAEANAALMARNNRQALGTDGNDYASMKLLAQQQQPPTSSSETNSYDEDPTRKPPPAGCLQQQQREQGGSIDWLDQDTPPPPPQYDGGEGVGVAREPGEQHLECCPELLRGHRGPPAAIRYIVPPHQCQQCGGQKPGGQHQIQTLGRYRTEPPSSENTPAKPRRHISFTSTLPSAKFTP